MGLTGGNVKGESGTKESCPISKDLVGMIYTYYYAKVKCT